jgi:hypothetical protein
MDLLDHVCNNLVEHPLLPLAISFASAVPVSEHSSYPYMATTHYCQNSTCSLSVLLVLLLLRVYQQPPLQKPLFLPEQISFCTVHESQPFSLVHTFSHAFRIPSALLSVYQGTVVVEWKFHQLMLQYFCAEPSDAFEFYVKRFIERASKT